MRRLSIIIVFTGIVLAAIFFAKKYKITSFVCVSQFNKCSDEVLGVVNNTKRGDLLSTRKELVKRLSDDPLVKKYALQLNLHGQYVIHIEERTPAFCIKGSKGVYIADAEGLVIKNENDSNMRCVSKEDVDYKLGEKLSEEDYFVQRLIYKLRNISEIGDVNIEGDNLIVEYKGKIKLIFPSEGDLDSLSGKAYYTVSQFDNIEEYIIKSGKISLSKIDFRFKHPVIQII